MSKYKIGDKVKIREDLMIFGSDSFIKHISKFKGKEVTIEEVNNKTNSYKLKVKFPKVYDSFDYQDIVEAIFLEVDSKQLIN